MKTSRDPSVFGTFGRHGAIGIALLVLASASLAAARSGAATARLLDRTLALEHVRFLSSDELAGRGNGTEGLERAAEYIASQFERYGLEPAGVEGTYFQPFTVLMGGRLEGAGLRFEGVETLGELRRKEHFEPMTFTSAGSVEGPIVFAGYGISAPEHDYDDYAGIDARGKIVLILRHTPREKDPASPFDADRGHATFVAKAVNAKAHGATAVLLVNDPLHHRNEPDALMPFGANLGADHLDIPAIHLKQEIAEELFRAAGKDLAAVQKEIDDRLAPSSFELSKVTAGLEVDVKRTSARVRNVLGYVPPRDASGEEELLVIGAHYDHLGLGERDSRVRSPLGQIHNGADDNASGTAGILELARVFATRDDLKRGILFAAFGGEELGLLGSRHYTQNPTLPLENTVAMLNLDMIGRLRDDHLFIGGVGSSPVFRPQIEELGAADGLSLSFDFSGYGSSDHTSFTVSGIPALFFFTGLHGDYHKPTDDWQHIDAAGIERVLRLAYRLADRLQELPERPAFVRTAAERPHGGQGGGYGAYFGSVPDFAHQEKGVRFSDVQPGSPAAAAGLRAGDVLVELAGRPIDNLYDFTDALRRHEPGEVVTVKVLRDGENLEASVKLGRRP